MTMTVLEKEISDMESAQAELDASCVAFKATQEAFQKALREAQDRVSTAQSMVPSWRTRQNLMQMKDLARQNKVITVYSYANTIAGVVVKRTPARVTVLTQQGDMVFSLSETKYLPAGYGIGDARAYHIHVEDL
jgi:hypothetical protein